MSTSLTKTFSWEKAILLCLGVGLLTAGLSVFVQTRNQIAQGFRAEGQKASIAAPVPVNTGSSFEAPGQPVRLLIPSINVDAVIQSVGLSWKDNGELGVPTNFTDVAWYNKGPLPGSPGSSVINGHFDGIKVAKAVFYSIDKLKPGDLVEVIDKGGKTLQFRVVGSQIYDYNASTTGVFSGNASKARLNLITCAGDWIKNQKLYNKRIVVFTELVSP